MSTYYIDITSRPAVYVQLLFCTGIKRRVSPSTLHWYLQVICMRRCTTRMIYGEYWHGV